MIWMLVQGQGVGAWGSAARGGVPGSGYGSMMGGGGWGDGSMMGGTPWGRPDTTDPSVENLDDARSAAEAFVDDLGQGMGVGEVMQFDNHYYAEIVGADGELATEVLVDPTSGTVQIEYGPARMWNTRFGMMAAGSSGSERVTAAEAERIADRWLADQGDLTADGAEELPGYYTLHTLRDGALEGMLSVNSTTGDVWYHSWHGQFVDMSEAP
ncbi:hypothetical protein [Actinotalea ferrariae]|uniref:hypothetical protein n=1 Tax=Actinotalea ferrariae TaxID=1386098 RepID=UPI001C1E4407|nr:hypothetical protein [Actinotalea ferrariae]